MRLIRLILLCLIMPAAALAQSFEEIARALPEGSYDDRADRVSALASSGDPRAEALLTALVGGDLAVLKSDGRLVIVTDGSATDALSGDPAGSVTRRDVTPVRVNNNLRGHVRAALGTLGLVAESPAARTRAAAQVEAAPDPAQLSALEAALSRETDTKARDALEIARASVLLVAPDATPDERAEALALIAERRGAAAQGRIRPLLSDPALKDAARTALADIERAEALRGWGLTLWQGLSLGSVLLLAAIGLSITFGVCGVINMAHGELVMLGAYTTFMVQEVIRTHAPGLFDWSLAIALPLAFLVTAAIGIAVERGIVRRLYGRPLETLLATWGVSLILQQAVRSIFGPNNRQVGNPSWMSGSVEVLGLSLTWNRIWIMLFALAVFGFLMLVLRRTALGLQMRAVTQNRAMAAEMGIRTGRVDALTFGLGAGIAGLAGVALSQIDNVSPNLGQGYIVDSFMVVVFGGAGSLWGTLAGAFTLGIVNKLAEPLAGAMLAKVMILIFIILFIQKRPRGLFPTRGRAVEG
ncbi:urea ABC transporter permease subunit UrtB [Paracoccus kondratievae]|uniref:urea ABC transporter permease subunit UrtB n=1 Tax=Paracoccus TaxID=265 RepID=UPI000A0E9B70|nr:MULTISPECIES: urea ABC transporter permease subunit UrtB [Paracoccus]QFQ88474.1 urea ABC transporter permease subunit UrtB [Paracoccus kondratievae]SMG26710.1 amino acid/amide ABC transporter membrane protein 1, HAAT family (TC 3.A.1.4.-) [Paracoccus sp. J56]